MKPQGSKPFINYDANAKKYLLSIGINSFNQIKFPGGTSADRSHYCGGLDWIETETSIAFLIVPYNSEIHKTEASQMKPLNEHKLGTLYRETHEETGRSITQEPFELEAATVRMPNHTKYFFLIDGRTCRGELLQDEINKFDPETGKPMYLPLEILNEVLYFHHRAPLKVAIDELCKISRELCEKAMNKFV